MITWPLDTYSLRCMLRYHIIRFHQGLQKTFIDLESTSMFISIF
jgi:hypothetical protein